MTTPKPPLSKEFGLSFETAGDKSDDPLVLLHGFTGTCRTWDALTERLAKEHFLIMPDLPGHGRSGVRSAEDTSLDATCIAVADILDRASEEDDLKKRKVAILGYSLGGRVALDFALRYQERLSCLVLESSSPGIQDPTEREDRRARDDALAADIERRGQEWFVEYWQGTPLFAAQKDLEASVFQKLRRERLSNTAAGMATSLRSAGAGRMVPLWDGLQDIKVPVLLIAGKRDEKYAGIAEAMKTRIPNSTVVVIDGSGHCVHVEKPDEFGSAVEAFLEGGASRPTWGEEKRRWR